MDEGATIVDDLHIFIKTKSWKWLASQCCGSQLAAILNCHVSKEAGWDNPFHIPHTPLDVAISPCEFNVMGLLAHLELISLPTFKPFSTMVEEKPV